MTICGTWAASATGKCWEHSGAAAWVGDTSLGYCTQHLSCYCDCHVTGVGGQSTKRERHCLSLPQPHGNTILQPCIYLRAVGRGAGPVGGREAGGRAQGPPGGGRQGGRPGRGRVLHPALSAGLGERQVATPGCPPCLTAACTGPPPTASPPPPSARTPWSTAG